MSYTIDPDVARQFDRLPPSSVEAERCVLGSLMLCGDDREAFMVIASRVSRDQFYQADHQVYFDVLSDIFRMGKPIDAVIVREEIRRRQLWEDVGGAAYMAQIIDSVPHYAHGAEYAATVREKHALRQLIAASNDLLRECYSPLGSLEAVAGVARRYASRIAEVSTTGAAQTFVRMSKAVEESLNAKSSGSIPQIPTGLADLDRVAGGLPLARFILIGGRPGSGKSQLCKQIVLNVASVGVPCGIVTIEETRHKIADNAVSNYSGVENSRIAYNNLCREEWDEIGKADKALQSHDIWINDQPTRLAEVEEAVVAAAVRHKCRVVVVDYLQLIDTGERMENENREVTKISRCLKALAKRLNIALIAACQLNRGNEAQGVRRPALRDLRSSGSLEQDGDLIILLHREDYYHQDDPDYHPTHQLEAIVAKNKSGCTANVPLRFSGRYQRITDWSGPPTAGGIAPVDGFDN